MSTILKSAAMSLLSKTLQTFLSKYLSDVDVEGVALPSVYDGSGWGVRLSNVKLREGVQLLKELPGKIPKQRKKSKRRRKKSTVSPRSTKLQVGESSEIPTSNAPQTPSLPTAPSYNTDDDLDNSIHMAELNQAPATTTTTNRRRLSSYEDLEISADDANTPPTTPGGSRPSTPLQDSKSIFSCFTTSRNGSKPPAELPDLELQPENKTPDLTAKTTSAEEDDLPQTTSQVSPLATTEEAFGNPSKSLMDQYESTHIEEDDKDKEDPDEDSEEEFEDYEQSFKLCLGDNGTIGTLDIRLVDKELHVLVEDAVLTIEAFPIAENEDGTDPNADANGDDAEGDVDDSKSTASATTAATGSASKKAKTTKAEAKRDTIGDRVLADNPLARAIASIPHLFLRDVRIRLILRKEPRATAQTAPSNAVPNDASATETNNTPETQSGSLSDTAGPEDTMLEIGIDFLSISGGDDILSHFQGNANEENPEDKDGSDTEIGSAVPRPPPARNELVGGDQTVDTNEYLVRHIRTGRGPSAGIWVQVFCPTLSTPFRRKESMDTELWARQRWVQATNYHLLRCSGIDIQARIHLGSKKEIQSSWFYDYEYESTEYDYDDTALDSLLIGIDTVVPGPQFALPPSNTNMSRGNTPRKEPGQPHGFESAATIPIIEKSPSYFIGADAFSVDDNNIESCRIPSSFHRISRGLLPGSCKFCHHLPSETCPQCWEVPAGVTAESDLDKSLPLPGLALQITFREPLQFNLDRGSIETLGLLKKLFAKKKTPNENNGSNSGEATNDTLEKTGSQAATTKKPKGRSLFSSLLSSKTNEEEEEPKLDVAFSKDMQPEKLQVVGMHFTDVTFRVHVLDEKKNDMGLTFCYWDLATKCITLDQLAFKSDALSSQDVKADVGFFQWVEYQGSSNKELLSLGVPVSGDMENGSSDANDSKDADQVPWPSVACALMDIRPPTETLAYKNREHHGIQARFISVKNSTSSGFSKRSLVNLRIGAASIGMPWRFWTRIKHARMQIVEGIRGKQTETTQDKNSQATTSTTSKANEEAKKSEEKNKTPPNNSHTTYCVQVDGGNIMMDPMLRMDIPATRVAGQIDSESGFAMETVLNKLKLEFGKQQQNSARMLSLSQMAELPENIRMRILLCLKDLSPLEQAFDVKRELNAFKRTRAVNKGIVKMTKKLEKLSSRTKKNSKLKSSATRRQQILSKLVEMDDDELDELWSVHHKYKRKLARKQKDEGK